MHIGEPNTRAARPDLTELAAAKFVESHGPDGIGILAERAERAQELGHRVAARTWRAMAEAAARLLGAAPPGPLDSGVLATGPANNRLARPH